MTREDLISRYDDALCRRELSALIETNWLTDNCWLLGLAGQNWMLVVGGGLLIYIGALAIARRRARAQRVARKSRSHPIS
jgi:hypothetical protein